MNCRTVCAFAASVLVALSLTCQAYCAEEVAEVAEEVAEQYRSLAKTRVETELVLKQLSKLATSSKNGWDAANTRLNFSRNETYKLAEKAEKAEHKKGENKDEYFIEKCRSLRNEVNVAWGLLDKNKAAFEVPYYVHASRTREIFQSMSSAQQLEGVYKKSDFDLTIIGALYKDIVKNAAVSIAALKTAIEAKEAVADKFAVMHYAAQNLGGNGGE